MADAFDVAAFCAGYRSRVEEAEVCLRADLPAKHAALDDELRAVRRSDPARAKVLAEELVAIEAEMAEASQVFMFQGLADEPWDQLVAGHPPTKAQLERQPNLGWNPDTFIPAAVAAASLDPQLSPDDVARLRITLRPADFAKLWQATWDANQEATIVPKSELATATLRARGASSTTPHPGGSPDPCSTGTPPGLSPPSTTTTTRVA